ncbi:MAG: DegV family protein [Anaerolineales bacterium]|nr:DegV family protein [Anaerolineales bacterium]
MSKIAIVTDSTAYLPQEIITKLNITVAPQILIWGEETLRDGIDIKSQEFYTRLKTAKIMPTTSQVPIITMQNIFTDMIDKGYDVIGVFISSKLSGTIQSAIQAKEMMGSAGKKVTVVDSKASAMALGFQTLAVARAVEAGRGLKDCIALAHEVHKHTGVFFAVDTLEFLHRGGRIGGAQRFFGSALGLKPILGLNDGRIDGVERIRTKRKAHERILELVAEQVKGKSNIRVACFHANAEEDAKALLEKAREKTNAMESILTELSPVVGNHTGPGTVGLAYMTEL